MQLDIVVSPPASHFDYCKHVVFIHMWRKSLRSYMYFLGYGFWSSDFLSSLYIGQVKDRQNAICMSPLCTCTGGLKNYKWLSLSFCFPSNKQKIFAVCTTIISQEHRVANLIIRHRHQRTPLHQELSNGGSRLKI